MMITAFVNTEESPLRRRGICFYTKVHESDKIRLIEVVEYTYPHPDCEGQTITVTEEELVGERHRYDGAAAAWVLLEAAQKAVRRIS